MPSSLACLRAALAAICLSLSACATYHANSPNPATLRGGSNRQSLYYWDIFEIREIDGQSIGMPLFLKSDIKVDPGPHMVVAVHHGNRGLFGGSVTGGFLAVQAYFQPGGAYEAYGMGTEGKARFWVRDRKSGQVVSKVAEQPLMEDYQRQAVFVPIVVPVRR